MFTLDQINATHARVKSGADFPRYVHEMKALGVTAYDMYVSDGHAHFFGEGSFSLPSAPKHEAFTIAKHDSSDQLQAALARHQRGETDYPTFCRQAAAAGVEKWSVNTIALICTYYNIRGKTMLVEAIPAAAEK